MSERPRSPTLERWDRRQCLCLLGLGAGALAAGCTGEDHGPVHSQPVRVDSRLLGALDREPVNTGVSIGYTDTGLNAASIGVDADGRFSLETIFGSSIRVTADGYATRVATPIDVIGPELFLIPLRDPGLRERLERVFLDPSDGLIRLPSLHLTAGERRRTMTVLFAPDLPGDYRDTILEWLLRADELSDGGLDYDGIATREGPVIDSPEDNLFKFRLSDSIQGDAETLVKHNTKVISGSSTTLRKGLPGARLRDVVGHEVLRSWGGFGASPNGGLRTPGAAPEDSLDVPMVTIAYRLEAGYLRS